MAILDRGELAISDLRATGAAGDGAAARDAAAATAAERSAEASDESEPDDDPADADTAPPRPAHPSGPARPSGPALPSRSSGPARPAPPARAVRPVRAAPTDVAIDVTAPHPGRFAVTLGYATDRLAWDAAYTLTTTAARDRAVLRGAIAIRNTTGVALRARTRVIDAELGAWRDRTAEQLRAAIVDGAAPALRDAPAHALGAIALGDGETRFELVGAAAPHALRSVLVYDPIGAGLDHTGAIPVSDPSIGADADAPTQVSESFEVRRDPRASRGLPAGPVRLLERRADGSLALLGESRLFDASTRVADVDIIAIGPAQGVIGHRQRRGWAKDDDQRRFSEEFLITIDNARPRPVELVLREHLYRGQNWTLAYQSVPAVKEGPQQIALRTTVPANGQAKVLYVVVYTW